MSEKNEKSTMKKIGNALYTTTMAGCSYAIPVILAGAVINAICTLFGGIDVASSNTLWGVVATAANNLSGMMMPVMCMYAAYSIADRAALAPALCVGLMANANGSSFVGAIAGGLCVGYTIVLLKKYVKVPEMLKPVMPILIIPVVATFVNIIIMNYIVGPIFAAINAALLNFLYWAQGKTPFIFGYAMGLLCTDCGGPISRTTIPVCLAEIANGTGYTVASIFEVCMCPPLAIAFSMLVAPKKWKKQDRANIASLIIGGCTSITEFALPYVLADFKHTWLPMIILAPIGAGVSMALGLSNPVFHGGFFTTAFCNKPLIWLIVFFANVVVCGTAISIFRKPVEEKKKAVE